jgi:hypothetical protein
MKTNYAKVALIGAMGVGEMITSCGSSKSVASSADKSNENPFGKTFTMPCVKEIGHDNDEFFTAVGTASGSKNRQDILQNDALTNAQNMVRQKLAHAYEGAIEDYRLSTGDNSGTDRQLDNEAGGRQIIDQVVNATKVVCGPEFTGVDANGNMNCYIGIKISIAEVSKKVMDNLSKSKTKEIRDNAKAFHDKLNSRFQQEAAQAE